MVDDTIIKVLIIGALGTFLINILRIVVFVLVAYCFGQLLATIVHDYGSILTVIAWLFFFPPRGAGLAFGGRWFSDNFVLEEKAA